MPDHVARVGEGVRRVLAPNPSPLTNEGTNTYLLGEGRVAIVDPGPAIPAHLAAILAALAPGERVEAILVTHAHLDHSPLARPLAEATGAPVFAGGMATEGRSPAMEALAAGGLAGGGEGLDPAFAPDERLADGARLDLAGLDIEAVATPGHLGTHFAFDWRGTLFSGDHVMGWSTSLVSPPDGDMGAYMASLEKLARRPARRYLPGHGAPVEEPARRVAQLLAHRRMREAAILGALGDRPIAAADLAARLYVDTPPRLLPAAARNVLAHLIELAAQGLAEPAGPLAADTGFLRRDAPRPAQNALDAP